MARVEIYTKIFCGFCHSAKRLLTEKGVVFEEHDISMGGPYRDEMIQRAAGRTSVPQIFIDDKHIGGSDDLYALEESGRLDPMLSGAG